MWWRVISPLCFCRFRCVSQYMSPLTHVSTAVFNINNANIDMYNNVIFEDNILSGSSFVDRRTCAVIDGWRRLTVSLWSHAYSFSNQQQLSKRCQTASLNWNQDVTTIKQDCNYHHSSDTVHRECQHPFPLHFYSFSPQWSVHFYITAL